MPRSTEQRASSGRAKTLKQLSLLLAIIVLGLGALGAHFGLRGIPPSIPEALPLRASSSSALPSQAQVHHVANSGEDVGPGEVESDLANCPAPVR